LGIVSGWGFIPRLGALQITGEGRRLRGHARGSSVESDRAACNRGASDRNRGRHAEVEPEKCRPEPPVLRESSTDIEGFCELVASCRDRRLSPIPDSACSPVATSALTSFFSFPAHNHAAACREMEAKRGSIPEVLHARRFAAAEARHCGHFAPLTGIAGSVSLSLTLRMASITQNANFLSDLGELAVGRTGEQIISRHSGRLFQQHYWSLLRSGSARYGPLLLVITAS